MIRLTAAASPPRWRGRRDGPGRLHRCARPADRRSPAADGAQHQLMLQGRGQPGPGHRSGCGQRLCRGATDELAAPAWRRFQAIERPAASAQALEDGLIAAGPPRPRRDSSPVWPPRAAAARRDRFPPAEAMRDAEMPQGPLRAPATGPDRPGCQGPDSVARRSTPIRLRGTGVVTGFPDFATLPDFAEARPAPLGNAGGKCGDVRGHRHQAALQAPPMSPASTSSAASRDRAVPARSLPDHVRHQSVDHPPVCRLFHRRGVQRLLSPQPRRPARWASRSPSTCHPPRLRLRQPARHRRCRHGRGRDRLDPRHAHAFLRHPARQDERLDDHERRGAAGDGPLHRRRRGAGRRPCSARRHDPERHPQGVHGPQHLHLPARGLDADRRRHLRLHGRARCRSSTRSRSAATTCRKPAPRSTWSSPTPWPTASTTCAPASPPA